jgi:hypothetical protein
MRRVLLAKLGRGREALESAWAEFQAHPSKFTYDELIRYVPKSERGSWHEKAMAASEQGDFASLIELWLDVKETERLVERLNRVSDAELEGLSHYVTEPAAKHLARTHPAVAAKVFRALCVRILSAAKSKYYHEALANLEEARRCYKAAGLDERWRELVIEIRREYRASPVSCPASKQSSQPLEAYKAKPPTPHPAAPPAPARMPSRAWPSCPGMAPSGPIRKASRGESKPNVAKVFPNIADT